MIEADPPVALSLHAEHSIPEVDLVRVSGGVRSSVLCSNVEISGSQAVVEGGQFGQNSSDSHHAPAVST
jgi:hypothetical protein